MLQCRLLEKRYIPTPSTFTAMWLLDQYLNKYIVAPTKLIHAYKQRVVWYLVPQQSDSSRIYLSTYIKAKLTKDWEPKMLAAIRNGARESPTHGISMLRKAGMPVSD
mmetsp:Transcript_99016/g.263094  ORF Transcript_99016/g.263094 Transcript_99016/m.263094 type:complete len:107 (-) Transcript_99016:85-405(-)